MPCNTSLHLYIHRHTDIYGMCICGRICAYLSWAFIQSPFQNFVRNQQSSLIEFCQRAPAHVSVLLLMYPHELIKQVFPLCTLFFQIFRAFTALRAEGARKKERKRPPLGNGKRVEKRENDRSAVL